MGEMYAVDIKTVQLQENINIHLGILVFWLNEIYEI